MQKGATVPRDDPAAALVPGQDEIEVRAPVLAPIQDALVLRVALHVDGLSCWRPAPEVPIAALAGGAVMQLSVERGRGDELADVLMSRYEKRSTIVTSNRPVDDWAKLLGDVVVVTPLLDRLMHHAHLLKFEGKSWRLKEAAARVATRAERV